MAGRKTSQSLEYFPLDVNYDSDPKWIRLIEEFGDKGELIALKVLKRIYRSGYYLQCDDDLYFAVAHDTKSCSHKLVGEVVSAMCRCGLLDRESFEKHSVLTSRGIQERWLNAVKRRKAIDTENYWLLEALSINADNNSINVNINEDDATECIQQSTKEKEKVNDKIRTDSVVTAFAEKPDDSISEAQELYRDYYGNRDMLKVKKLCQKYGAEAVCDAIDAAGERATMNPYKYIEQMLFVSEECVRA